MSIKFGFRKFLRFPMSSTCIDPLYISFGLTFFTTAPCIPIAPK